MPINYLKQHDLTYKLRQAADAYYNTSVELMSNEEYDRLYSELEAMEKESGKVFLGSPTQKVGSLTSNGCVKVRHEYPMLSLNKTKKPDDLLEFLGDRCGVLSWKLDGMTLVLTYEDGKLISASTRGNGYEGENVYANALRIRNIPKEIPVKDHLVIRGEAIISYEDFDMVNTSEGSEFANPRNLVSGTIRAHDPRLTEERCVRFVAYELCGNPIFATFHEDLEALEELGFEVVEGVTVFDSTIESSIKYFTEKSASYIYPVDGLVLRLDDRNLDASLGATARFPRHSIAFKWADKTYETTLTDILWHTSSTGLINPIAVFEPVKMVSSIVSKASLFNAGRIMALKLHIGDRIKVYKANMVIPQISDNITGKKDPDYTLYSIPNLPVTCPCCGGPIMVEMSDATTKLYCTNPNCIARMEDGN